MTRDPYTQEKEFYMRVDVNSLKLNPKNRPSLELHVVVDPKASLANSETLAEQISAVQYIARQLVAGKDSLAVSVRQTTSEEAPEGEAKKFKTVLPMSLVEKNTAESLRQALANLVCTVAYLKSI